MPTNNARELLAELKTAEYLSHQQCDGLAIALSTDDDERPFVSAEDTGGEQHFAVLFQTKTAARQWFYDLEHANHGQNDYSAARHVQEALTDLRQNPEVINMNTNEKALAALSEKYAKNKSKRRRPVHTPTSGSLASASNPNQVQQQPATPPAQQEPPAMTPSATKQEALLAALAALNEPTTPAITSEQIEQLVAEALAKQANQTVQVNMIAPKNLKATIKAGAHEKTAQVVKTLAAGEHLYLYGPSGSGKTTMAQHAAEALSIAFHATGAVFEPYSLLGYNDAHGEYVTTAFRTAFEYGGVFLFDELDASAPEAVAVFNMALANKHCVFPDKAIKQHKDFYVIAAGNTKGRGADNIYTARQALDGATLDRFVMLEIGYCAKTEQAMARKAAAEFGLTTHFADLVAEHAQDYRARAKEAHQQHLITPRNTARLVKLAGLGYDKEEALQATFYAHAGEDAARQCPVLITDKAWCEAAAE